MPLDPQVQALLDQVAALNVPPYQKLTVQQARDMIAAVYRGEPAEVAKVEDRTIPGPGGPIPVRIYTPAAAGPLPLLVFFHGGGWVIGNLDSHDVLARDLANGGSCVVVSVDYRLAPEHKFPAAAEDSYAATVWAAENAAAIGADPVRLAIAGDSAGGNLAAVVAQLARDRGGPAIAYQVLAYPVTDFNFETPSYASNAEGYLLSRDSMIWFWNHYLAAPADGANPYASPLRATSLAGLPPALVLTAEYDPLRSEGQAYAEALRAAGVRVEAIDYAGLIHGFLSRPQFDRGREAVALIGARLREVFGPRS